MADQDGASASQSQNEDESEFIPGFKGLNDFTQIAFRHLMLAIKGSNELPSAGDDFDYYSSFESFRHLMDMEGTRILQLMQKIMKYHSAKGSLTANSEIGEIDDKFDVLIDANDQLLERVGTHLDEAMGLKKEQSPMIVASLTKKQPISGSWNKKSPKGTPHSKGTSYRLLAAKNIQRPQVSFKDKIDNSSKPFVPVIKEKPNAMVPLQDTLTVDEDDLEHGDDFSFPHPYQYELDHFKPVPEQMEPVEPQKPMERGNVPVVIIETEAALRDLCTTLKKEKEIAVDLEHHSYRSYQGFTCLMQISTRTQDFLVDTIELRSYLYVLNEVFTDPTVVKVLHGADMDVEWLQRDLGLYLVNMFDTGQACRVLSYARYSLAHLLLHFCQVEADKQYQLADWRIRPLPEELVNYARDDTHYLLYIYDCMKNELLEKGHEQKNLLHAVLERSRAICAKRYKKPVYNEDNSLELSRKHRKTLNSQQMAALRGIHAWRDRVARLEDESLGYVLPNHMLLQIAELLPREPAGILACCTPTPPLVRHNLNEIHSFVVAAREQPLVRAAPGKPVLKPTRLEHPKYNTATLLRGPHDLSHQDQQQRRLAKQSQPAAELTVAVTPSMFKDSPGIRIKESRRSPIMSGLASASKSRDAGAARKADAIRALFANPFVRYFPDDLLEDEEKVDDGKIRSTKDKRHGNLDMVWKLLPHTIKADVIIKPVATRESVPRAPQADVIDLDVMEAEEAVPLSKQFGMKKKRKQSKVDAMLQAPLAASSQGKRPRVEDPDAPLGQRDESVTSQSPGGATEGATEEFTPHDYSKADYKMFEGGKSKKQRSKSKPDKQYDPDATPQHDFKPVKARVNTKEAHKSMSFGGKNATPKIHWPKR